MLLIIQELLKAQCNNTDIIYTDYCDTDLILSFQFWNGWDMRGVTIHFAIKKYKTNENVDVDKNVFVCYTNRNSAFAEISSLKTDFREEYSNIADEVLGMAVSYKKLWKILIDRDMKKKDLCVASGVSHASMAKLGKNGNVTTDVLVKICTALQCDIGDIMEVVDDVQ